MECRRCAACDQAFRPRAQVPRQRYCGLAACQRERRRRWQQSKRHSDEDYRANQARAQRVWADDHGDYWREWRAATPITPIATVLSSVGATASRQAARLAKMDASTADYSRGIRDIPSGAVDRR